MAFGFFSFVGYTSLFVVCQRVIKGRFVRPGPVKAVPNSLQTLTAIVGMTLISVAVLTSDRGALSLNPRMFTWPWLRGLGYVVTVAGLVLSMWAQTCLGSNMFGGAGLYKRHRLITNGPYKWVRHPLYSGMLVSAMGLALVGLDVWFGLAVLIFLGSYALRIPAEDALLRKRFKANYDRYRASTPALVPRLWRRH
jgi:protein-S-isoprenylcysteine O-methyltransferase Ste14